GAHVQERVVLMREGMVSDFMSLAQNAAENFRIPFGRHPDGKKDGPCIMPGKAIKDGRSEFRVRTIVERQQYRLARITAQSVNHTQGSEENLSTGGLDPHVALRIRWLDCGRDFTKQPNRSRVVRSLLALKLDRLRSRRILGFPSSVSVVLFLRPSV